MASGHGSTSAKGAAPAKEAGEAEAAPAKSKKKLLVLAVPIVLLVLVAGLWFSGIIPGMLAKKPPPVASTNHDAPPAAAVAAAAAAPPVFVDIPEILTNLNVAGKRQSYVKLHAKLEVPSKADVAGVEAALPRIQDLFQTYLRDMRPEELRGSEGSYRLREELIGRAAVAAAPAHVSDVLFIEMVIQ
jgi:flagellar FliL protein